MAALKDRTGEVRGRLTFVRPVESSDGPNIMWEARCECGKIVVIRGNANTKSCGCLLKEWNKSGNARRSHGLRKTPEYRAWAEIKQMCLNPNNPRFPTVGGRGIKMDAAWQTSFEAFFNEIGPRPGPGYKLTRVDRDGHYEATNCRWVPIKGAPR